MSSNDGSRPPRPRQRSSERELAARYAPIIYFDRNEPFLPLVVGYTVFRRDGESPSFPRRIELSGSDHAPAVVAIEYAIWWDWDIQHLYELEHAWTYVGADGSVVFAEASWHGGYSSAVLADGSVPLIAGGDPADGSHPILYSQPGKHAFVPVVEGLLEVSDKTAESCGPRSGTGGLWVTPLFQDILGPRKNPQVDALVTAYLKSKAFIPASVWDKEFRITRDMLVPWPALFDWVPARVDWWIARLRAGKG